MIFMILKFGTLIYAGQPQIRRFTTSVNYFRNIDTWDLTFFFLFFLSLVFQ